MRLIYVLLIVFALGPTPAFADDPPYTPKFVPVCKLYKTVTGIEVCGFDDIEDWKKILVVDVELVHAREQLKNEQAKGVELLKMKALMTTEVEAMAQSQTVLKQANDKLTQQLIDLDKKYQDERVKPRWGSPLAWTLAAASTALLAGVVIALVLN